MATDSQRYEALRTYAVRWGFLPAELSHILRDARATAAEFDAMADKAVIYVREQEAQDHPPNAAAEAEYASWAVYTPGVSGPASSASVEGGA